jgi:uncharacterized protein (UPF0276 family)
MISTLAVSHLINKNNYSEIRGIKALEYRNIQPVIDKEMECLFHSGLGIVQRGFIENVDLIIDHLNDNDFKLFSFDLGPSAEDVEYNDYFYITKSAVIGKSQLKKRIQRDLSYIKRKFKGIIALENLNYFPTPAYSTVCDADFIKEVIEENDVYLTLDIAHAIISANNLSINLFDYLSSLPLDRVIEVHLSAPGKKNGKWMDCHEKPGIKEVEALDFLAERIPTKSYLVVEYYKDFISLHTIYNDLQKYFQ